MMAARGMLPLRPVRKRPPPSDGEPYAPVASEGKGPLTLIKRVSSGTNYSSVTSLDKYDTIFFQDAISKVTREIVFLPEWMLFDSSMGK